MMLASRLRTRSSEQITINTVPARARAMSDTSIIKNMTNQNVVGNQEAFEDFVIEELEKCTTVDEVNKIDATIKHAIHLIKADTDQTPSPYFSAENNTDTKDIDAQLLYTILTTQCKNIEAIPETKEESSDDEEDKNDYDNRLLGVDLEWLKMLVKLTITEIILSDWENEANTCEQKCARATAKDKIVDCVTNQDEELYLIDIKLDSLPPFNELSKQLAHVKIISLQQNQLTKLPENGFAGLTNLKELDLSCNQFTEFAANELVNLPPHLEILILSDNEIKQLAPYNMLEKLTILDLANNEITCVTDEFCGLKDLKELNLSGNKIEEIQPKIFSGLGNIHILLDYNQITTIEDGVFNDLTGRNSIYLSENQISSVSGNAFNGILINELNLYGNKLKKIELNGLCVHTLRLIGNQINIINRNTFYDCFIGELYLSKNPIEKIEPSAFDIPGIFQIDLDITISKNPDIFDQTTAWNSFQQNRHYTSGGCLKIRYDEWVTSYLNAGDDVDPNLERLILGLSIVEYHQIIQPSLFDLTPIVINKKVINKLLLRILSNKIENGTDYLKFIIKYRENQELILKPEPYDTKPRSRGIFFEKITTQNFTFEAEFNEDLFNETIDELSNNGFNNCLRQEIRKQLAQINIPGQDDQIDRLIRLKKDKLSFKQFTTQVHLIIGRANAPEDNLEDQIELQKFIRYLYTKLEGVKKQIAIEYCNRMSIPRENQDAVCHEIINFNWEDAANQAVDEQRQKVGDQIIQLRGALSLEDYEELLLNHIFYLDIRQIREILDNRNGYETKGEDENDSISDSTRQKLELVDSYFNYLGEKYSPLILSKHIETEEACIIALPNPLILNENLKVDFQLQDIQIITNINGQFKTEVMTIIGIKTLNLPQYFMKILSTKFTASSIFGTAITEVLVWLNKFLRNGNIRLTQTQTKFTESVVQQITTNTNTTIIGHVEDKIKLIETKESGAPELMLMAQAVGEIEAIFTEHGLLFNRRKEPDSLIQRQNLLPKTILGRYNHIFDINMINVWIDNTCKKLIVIDYTITKEDVLYILAAFFWKLSSRNVFGYENETINQSSILERELGNICASLLLTSNSIDNHFSEAEQRKIKMELYDAVIDGGCTQIIADQLLPQNGNNSHPLREKRRRMGEILSKKISFKR